MKPVAVLISDVHYSVATLPVADAAMRQAFAHAGKLSVPIIIAGDLLDGKSIMRGECVNAIIGLLRSTDVQVMALVGNHDKLNEKGDAHSLEFLRPYARVIDTPTHMPSIGSWLVPYFSDSDKLLQFLHEEVFANDTRRLIMHQGLKGAAMGDYIVDRTSMDPSVFDGLRVVSGHYHRAQDIKCGKTGLWSFLGSPYTVTYTEASDGPKGFRVLYEDGTLKSVPTNLRKHVIIETTTDMLTQADEHGTDPFEMPNPCDLVWLKVRGPYSELEALNKRDLAKMMGVQSFRFDKQPTDEAQVKLKVEEMTGEQMLDSLIMQSEETPAQKAALKSLWREVMSDK